MPVPWNADDPGDLATLEKNLRSVLGLIVRDAFRRISPSVELAKGWHRRVLQGVRLPVPYYAGEVRDSDPDFPELFGYEVAVGPLPGAPSQDVPAQLKGFEEVMEQAVERLDSVVAVGQRPTEPGALHSVLTLSALSHGEWVRIHPFANGNGRTARLWANWCAARYGLPPFVRLQPRPEGDAYGRAACHSMRGDHRAMVPVFLDLLTGHIQPES